MCPICICMNCLVRRSTTNAKYCYNGGVYSCSLFFNFYSNSVRSERWIDGIFVAVFVLGESSDFWNIFWVEKFIYWSRIEAWKWIHLNRMFFTTHFLCFVDRTWEKKLMLFLAMTTLSNRQSIECGIDIHSRYLHSCNRRKRMNIRWLGLKHIDRTRKITFWKKEKK